MAVLQEDSLGVQADAEPDQQAQVAFNLEVAGVVVAREKLVDALRPFVPLLIDIQPLQAGERFLLVFESTAEPATRR
jgi:hypothetical protein